MAITNVKTEIKGKELTIKVKLDEAHGPSKSGKTEMIGSTGGNVEITPGIYLGLNIYRYLVAK